ncbi:MAG: biotin--[acetyl-CoA-carboxylase] ligase [Alphaproteobacteria bacterium]|nr:biotin--[acetyl-CoA-carboxylase] ligase [Alphaproteobacteria bacterium]
MAAAQSDGRGRYRRKWISHHGNLYASFIYDAPHRDPRLAYSVAVAIAETLLKFGIAPQIKWPNDILVNGKKISGTLIEYAKDFVIIGIGINIASNPTVPNYETTKTDDLKPGISREDLLNELMSQMDAWIGKLSRGNFNAVRTRWLDLAIGIGAEITYRRGRATLCGINDDGALILRRGNEYIMSFADEISI